MGLICYSPACPVQSALPYLWVAEVSNIVRFVYKGKLNIRSEKMEKAFLRVDVVSELVKVLIPGFRLTLGLWVGGVVLEAVTCNLEGEKSSVKKPEEMKNCDETLLK